MFAKRPRNEVIFKENAVSSYTSSIISVTDPVRIRKANQAENSWLLQE